jgi:hypothetical protein
MHFFQSNDCKYVVKIKKLTNGHFQMEDEKKFEVHHFFKFQKLTNSNQKLM